jgi:hypothetical protein
MIAVDNPEKQAVRQIRSLTNLLVNNAYTETVTNKLISIIVYY